MNIDQQHAFKHILYARSGYSIAIKVIVEGMPEHIQEMEPIVIETVYDYYVGTDKGMKGGIGVPDKDNMRIDFPGMNGALIFTGEDWKGYSDDEVTITISLKY